MADRRTHRAAHAPGASARARRSATLPAALVALALTLAACAPAGGAAPAPTPGTPSAVAAPSATPGAAPTLSPDLAAAAARDRVEAVDPAASPWTSRVAAAPGLGGGQLLDHDAARPVSLTYPDVPLFPGLTAALAADAQARADDFRATHAPDAAAPPELNQGWALLAGSGTTVGVGLDTYVFGGASGYHDLRTLWVDATDAAPAPGAALVDEAQHAAVRDRVLAALHLAGHADAPWPGTPTTEDDAPAEKVLAAVSFTDDGLLRVALTPGVALPSSAGAFTVTLDGDPSALLSPLGRHARAASAADAPPLPAPAPPPPTVAPGAPPARVDCAVASCVALTFDDGPGDGTGAVLDALAARDARATFFLVGQNVSRHADVVRRMVAEGHEVGNHTWDHRQLTQLSATQQRAELDEGAAAIAAVTGTNPTIMRPPYGSWNADTAGQGLPIILWGLDTWDWRTRSTQATVDAVLTGAQRGSIVLMHDIHATTVAAVPAIVNGLSDKGFTLVTVSELYGGDLKAGYRYVGTR